MNRRNIATIVGFLCAVNGLAIVERNAVAQQAPAVLQNDQSADPQTDLRARELSRQRDLLDETVWSEEVAAQQYEDAIIQLWDRLRQTKHDGSSLLQFAFRTIAFGSPKGRETLDLGVQRAVIGPPGKPISFEAWQKLVLGLASQGFQVVESEWHHSAFELGDSKNNLSRSSIDFVLHIRNDRLVADSQVRAVVRGQMKINWVTPPPAGQAPQADTIEIANLQILTRAGQPAFARVFTYERRPRDVASAHPIIVYDLDRNGFPEIIISRWNRVYWNGGAGKFREGSFLEQFEPLAEAGLIVDLTRDGRPDFVTVNKQGQVVVFRGGPEGSFPDAPIVVSDVRVPNALSMTAGDIDQDGDLDLWVAQYKPSYLEGQMPTPYYDANDGEPAFLLINDGNLRFDDATEKAGLSSKRLRRTYSSSFFDFDRDGDLDLIVVSDYAGVDIYDNDGSGHFRDVTDQRLPERHLFGMAHTFGDYNLDGRLDLYAIGMSSTTARRLDRMGAGREDRPDIQQMRAAMGFGNRMYVRNEQQGFETPEFAAQVARTGWSWGTTSFDYDLDGDEDIYVANGFRSGQSCRDYCTTFWRHDLYTGSSEPDPAVAALFRGVMQDLNSGQMSWNGFEHNALLQNVEGQNFHNLGFLMGVAEEFDSRAVLANDLDGDGRPDLIVSEYEFVPQGALMRLHVYRNQLHTDRHWIGIRLYEDPAASLIGARVTLSAGDKTQVRRVVLGDSFLSQHAHVAHFGLGDQASVDRVTVQWPNGKVAEITSPAVDRYYDLSAGDAR